MSALGGLWRRLAGFERALGGVYDASIYPNPADKIAAQTAFQSYRRGLAGFGFRSYTYTHTPVCTWVGPQKKPRQTPQTPPRASDLHKHWRALAGKPCLKPRNQTPPLPWEEVVSTLPYLGPAEDPSAVRLYASTVNGPIPLWLDRLDAERLNGRRLSVGSHGYAQVWCDGQPTPVHRWVMGAQRGDGRLVDHLNGDPYDNRRRNLRFVTAAENAANRKCTAASGYRGVYATTAGKWTARVKINGQCIHLGTYISRQEAAVVSHEWRAAHLPGYVARDITTENTHAAVAA